MTGDWSKALLLVFLFTVSGCSSSTKDVPAESTEPDLQSATLTLEMWKQSTSEEKFASDVLDRLRKSNPDLRSAANWKKFWEEEFIPAFNGHYGEGAFQKSSKKS